MFANDPHDRFSLIQTVPRPHTEQPGDLDARLELRRHPWADPRQSHQQEHRFGPYARQIEADVLSRMGRQPSW